MVANRPLQDLKVLVTRPEHQAEPLCEQISAAGGQAIRLPVIDIKPIAFQGEAELKLEQQDIIIFISRNAVYSFVDEIGASLPEQMLYIAVGAATARAMDDKGLACVTPADKPAGSEAALAIEELRHVDDKNITIVRGKGGRELLADTLIARGANIQYIEAYERVLSSPTDDQRQQALQADVLVCTSVAGVENLLLLLKDYQQQLVKKPLIVVSERIKLAAQQLGFEYIMVTDNVSDDDIMDKLIELEDE